MRIACGTEIALGSSHPIVSSDRQTGPDSPRLGKSVSPGAEAQAERRTRFPASPPERVNGSQRARPNASPRRYLQLVSVVVLVSLIANRE